MKRSSGVARAAAALTVLGLLTGCDLYDAGLLHLGSTAPPLDSGTPFVNDCGNGRVDEGEECDTAIEQGETGACASECEPLDACSPQAPTGELCQRMCVTLQITAAINGDECCPEGLSPADDSDCGVCGDGITGPNETCEPAANCVTRDDCSATAACLRSTFRGDPDSCTSACRVTLIETCTSGDGCCPPGCNSQSDDDCSATCGNGIVEVQNNETCEAGSTSPCPTTCDDGIACTMDVPSGTAEQCNLSCSHLAITAPAHGDGCCPAGATSLNDDDCLPVCGNLMLEAGEACDPCPADCNDSNACTTDTRSGTGCSVVCSHPAVTTPTSGDGCCPNGANANNDTDCPADCGNGVVEAGEDCDGGGRCSAQCALVLPSSLVHRYSFNGTGTSALDTMGTAHGTVVNTTLSGNGRVTLAGSGTQYVDLPDGILSALTDVTIETWTTWQGGVNTHHLFDFGMNNGGQNPSSGLDTQYFYLNPGDGSSEMVVGMNFTPAVNDYAVADLQLRVTPPLSAGTRRHVVVTFRDPGASSTKTLRLYVDGVDKGSFSIPVSTSGTDNRLRSLDDRNVWLGRSNYSTSTYAGSVEEFRIYNAVLSGAQVTTNFNAGPNP
jgi:hypothetical protein